jgi:3-hydroxyacyl-[acyl-carrier-protein] dehydratase
LKEPSSSLHHLPPSLPFHGLPHRPPFVFVKDIIECEPGESAQARTVFDLDDPIFAGHFPGNPIVPGVILTEALAQVAGITAASGYPDASRPLFLLSAIRTMKFFVAARPGDQITLHAERIAGTDALIQFKVRATIDEAVAAEGQLVLSVADFASRPE